MIILGLGNALRGDDGLGQAAARLIHDRRPHWKVYGLSDLAGVFDHLAPKAHILLIDCLRGAGPEGSLHRFDLLKDPLPPLRSGVSSHGLGLPGLLEMAANLDVMPARFELWGLEGAEFGLQDRLSPSLQSQLEPLCAQVIQAAESAPK